MAAFRFFQTSFILRLKAFFSAAVLGLTFVPALALVFAGLADFAFDLLAAQTCFIFSLRALRSAADFPRFFVGFAEVLFWIGEVLMPSNCSNFFCFLLDFTIRRVRGSWIKSLPVHIH